MTSPALPDLFRESVEDMLRLAEHRLGVRFGIARFAGEEPIVSDPEAPLEEERQLVEMDLLRAIYELLSPGGAR